VPLFYLKHFLEPETPAGQEPALWQYDLLKKKAKRRSPRNMATVPDFYGARGGLPPGEKTIEQLLGEVESKAASVLRVWLAKPIGQRRVVPPEVGRFIGWLAARTESMTKIMSGWLAKAIEAGNIDEEIAETPFAASFVMPDGLVKHFETAREAQQLLAAGGDLRLGRQLTLEMIHIQAWLFQSKWLPRLQWVILDAPKGGYFVTSDRPVIWTAGGVKTDAEPYWLEHEAVQLFVPLSSRTALLAGMTPVPADTEVDHRLINAVIAAHATSWIAGPTRAVVEEAAADGAAIVTQT
jgi:hypothetical protein